MQWPFSLLRGCERFSSYINFYNTIVYVYINIKTLCDALCDEVERFLLHVSEEELVGHSVRIVDVAGVARLNQPPD